MIVPPALFDFDGALFDACLAESDAPVVFPDAGWYRADTFTFRAVFTATTEDRCRRAWIESCCFSGP